MSETPEEGKEGMMAEPQILDTTGTDLWPLIKAASDAHGVAPVLTLGMLKAESGLNPYAWRDGPWPDKSPGLSQVTIATAGGRGMGDGTNTPENIEAVKQALFDRATSINLGAEILAGCLRRAAREVPEATGDDQFLQALICYNSGSPQPEGNWYWQRWGGNIENYRGNLAAAHEALAAPADPLPADTAPPTRTITLSEGDWAAVNTYLAEIPDLVNTKPGGWENEVVARADLSRRALGLT